MSSGPYIRPIELRSWEDTSRLLAIMGSDSRRDRITNDPTCRALLVWRAQAVHRATLTRLSERAGVERIEGSSSSPERFLLAGTQAQLEELGRLLEEEGDPLAAVWRSRLRQPRRAPKLLLPRTELSLERPIVQAILNVTPDSFYDGGKHQAIERAIARAEEAVEQGADILDIGGESTRPGAIPVSEQDEISRVLPTIEALSRRLTVPISVDTSKHGVARAALEAGAQMINDISGLRNDPAMAGVVARHGAALIVMHMRGDPRTMQNDTHYDSLMGEILEVLEESIRAALDGGVMRDRILIDPGIGFAKTAGDNLIILRELGSLKCLSCPILIGASRKSFLERLFGWKLEDRLFGSLGAAAAAIMAGAQVVRVHDVLETRRVVDTVWAIREAGVGEKL